jgi:hypothetical protein
LTTAELRRWWSRCWLRRGARVWTRGTCSGRGPGRHGSPPSSAACCGTACGSPRTGGHPPVPDVVVHMFLPVVAGLAEEWSAAPFRALKVQWGAVFTSDEAKQTFHPQSCTHFIHQYDLGVCVCALGRRGQVALQCGDNARTAPPSLLVGTRVIRVPAGGSVHSGLQGQSPRLYSPP